MTKLTYLLRNELVKAYPVFDGCGPCKDKIPSLRERLQGVPKPGFPVDIVYTWVDGADPVMAAKRASFMPPGEQCHQETRGDCLYRDNQELRYSLRSVERYAPWVRRVFLLVDGQVPDWLNTRHDKLKVIDHKDCIPGHYLPTFNSNVIEAHLHCIPGLSEHYVYFNDDFFLTSMTGPEDFFTANGLPYVYVDWKAHRRQGYERANTPHARSHGRVRQLMQAAGISTTPDIIAAHVPYPQTLSNALDSYVFFEETILAFQKFRTMGEIAFNCHAAPLLAYTRRTTVPCDLTYYYMNAKRFDRRTCYEVLLRDKDSGKLPIFLCINDVGDAGPKHSWKKDMVDFLAAFYPEPSAYEL
ncbi:Stealth CR1 domain-containing protein [Desulfovibrio sp. OttesenSCG-928-A18]|nr:Stealth CR1 domain-containing protein [Desulfovibrio sp. OttesenSCG-928-A18]